MSGGVEEMHREERTAYPINNHLIFSNETAELYKIRKELLNIAQRVETIINRRMTSGY